MGFSRSFSSGSTDPSTNAPYGKLNSDPIIVNMRHNVTELEVTLGGDAGSIAVTYTTFGLPDTIIVPVDNVISAGGGVNQKIMRGCAAHMIILTPTGTTDADWVVTGRTVQAE